MIENSFWLDFIIKNELTRLSAELFDLIKTKSDRIQAKLFSAYRLGPVKNPLFQIAFSKSYWRWPKIKDHKLNFYLLSSSFKNLSVFLSVFWFSVCVVCCNRVFSNCVWKAENRRFWSNVGHKIGVGEIGVMRVTQCELVSDFQGAIQDRSVYK